MCTSHVEAWHGGVPQVGEECLKGRRLVQPFVHVLEVSGLLLHGLFLVQLQAWICLEDKRYFKSKSCPIQHEIRTQGGLLGSPNATSALSRPLRTLG